MQVHEDERKSRHRSKLALFQGFPDTSKLSMLPETRKSILDDPIFIQDHLQKLLDDDLHDLAKLLLTYL